MNSNYNDDQNGNLLPYQSQPMTVVQPPASNNFMDYVSNNRVVVVIALLILGFLLYWFCFRKSGSSTLSPNTDTISIKTPGSSTTLGKNSTVTISKSRPTGSSLY